MKSIILSCLFFLLLNPTLFSQEKDVFNVARYGTVAEMQTLIELDKDTINAVNNYSFTPLILACYRGNKDVAKFLIPKVNNLDYISSQGTALAATIIKNEKDLAKLLLENNADPNLVGADGATPLIYAVQTQNIDLIKLLLKYKPDISIKDQNDKSAFEYAIFTKNNEIINLLKS